MIETANGVTARASERLTEVTDALIDAILGVVRTRQIDERVLRQALAFLTEVGTANEFTLLSDVLGISVVVDEITHGGDALGTAHNVEGPAYRSDAPLLSSPARLSRDDEPGDELLLRGQVVSAVDGRALPDAVLDLWQTNAAGDYEHEDASQPDFNLRGQVQVDSSGAYAVRTVVPGPYRIAKGGPVGRLLLALGRHDWRPGHLHVRATASGHLPLTTMVFIPGDPWLGSDAIGAVKESLILQMEPEDRESGSEQRKGGRRSYTSRFDFALRPIVEP